MTADGTRPQRILLAAGIALAVGCVALAVLSRRFVYGSPMLERPIVPMVAILMTLGGIYVFAVLCAQRVVPNRKTLFAAIVIGFVMRLVFLPSLPILESDYYRYLWDGGVVASGHNPYTVIPNAVYFEREGVPQSLIELGKEAGETLARVNHAEVATIYPPAAQLAFAAAHLAAPWSLLAWRIVLLLCECLTLVVLLRILATLQWPKLLVIVYWWNPLVIKETINSAHMDALLVPLLLGAFYAAARNRAIASAITLALAAAVKVWPVILAPVLVRFFRDNPKRIAGAVMLGCALLIVLYIPVLSARTLGSDSGFAAYADRWEINDALFMPILGAMRAIESATDAGFDANAWARVIVAVIIGLAALAFAFRPAEKPGQLANRALWLTAILFMLSPTQFPWYFIWLTPWLALIPRPSFLILTAMLPMYYLRFYYREIDNVALFDHRLVWLEYAPTLVIVAWELAVRWRPVHFRDDSAHA